MVRYVRRGTSIEFIGSGYTVAVLSDLHFPYEDPDAMILARKIIDAARPDIVVLNGDVVDFFGISRFPVPPERRARFGEEVKRCAERIVFLKGMAPKATWVYVEGNHELRMQMYLWRRAPELSDLVDIEDELGLRECGILYVRQAQEPQRREDFTAPQVRVGKLYITHGHTIRLWGNAVNIARAVFQRLLKPVLIGHWHRKDIYSQTDYEGKLNGAFVQGCLCYPRPHWDSGRIWGQGMSIIYVQNGFFEVDVLEFIAKDKRLFCLWRGKRYETRIGAKRWA